MTRYEKTDQPGYELDRSTGTVINTNVGAFEAIKKSRMARKEQDGLVQKVADLEKRIKQLEKFLGQK